MPEQEDSIKKTVSGGGVVLNKKGEVLVVNQKGTSWSLPKGKIDQGEDVLQAAKREICEETGVTKLNLIKKLGTYHRYKLGLHALEDKSEYKTITIFLFTTPQTKLKPRDTDNPEAKWVKQQEVADILTHPKDKAFYRSVCYAFSHFQK